jgi:hypothetical protein
LLGLTLEAAKGKFFHQEYVADKLLRAKKKTLARMGAFVQRSARSSIKKPGKRLVKKLAKLKDEGLILSASPVSDPGKPPFSHTGRLREILFVWDAGPQSVIIGPVKNNAKSSGKAPGLLEFGGTEVIDMPGGGKQGATYEPRPYMAPALKANEAKFPSLFLNTVRK